MERRQFLAATAASLAFPFSGVADTPARILAGSGTHASANGGQGIGCPRHQEGFFEPALGDQLHVPAGVG